MPPQFKCRFSEVLPILSPLQRDDANLCHNWKCRDEHKGLGLRTHARSSQGEVGAVACENLTEAHNPPDVCRAWKIVGYCTKKEIDVTAGACARCTERPKSRKVKGIMAVKRRK